MPLCLLVFVILFSITWGICVLLLPCLEALLVVSHCTWNKVQSLHHSSAGHYDLVALSSSPHSSVILPTPPSVLGHLGCYNQNTIDWVTYKQQKIITHSSGSREVQD